ISDAYRRAAPGLSLGDRQHAGERLHEDALPTAVSADDADPLAAEDREVDVEQHRLVVERDRDAAQLGDALSAPFAAPQGQPDPAALEHRAVDLVHPLDPALGVPGSDRVAAVVDHARPLLVPPVRTLEARDLLLLGRERRRLPLQLALA